MIARFVLVLSSIWVFAGVATGFYAKEIADPPEWGLAWTSVALMIPGFLIAVLAKASIARQKRGAQPKRSRQTVQSHPRKERRADHNAAIETYNQVNNAEAYYQTGWHDLAENRILGREPAGLAFVMPLAIGITRQSTGDLLPSNLTKYYELTSAERRAVQLMHRCLTGCLNDVNQIMETTLSGKLFEAMYVLFRQTKSFGG